MPQSSPEPHLTDPAPAGFLWAPTWCRISRPGPGYPPADDRRSLLVCACLRTTAPIWRLACSVARKPFLINRDDNLTRARRLPRGAHLAASGG